MNELGVEPVEEMDLLIKWLGPESSKQAVTIRASNSHDPHRGLQRIWERLYQKYATPQTVESTIRRKLDTFPKLGPRDSTQLYDLSDMVSEIEAMKENTMYSTVLAYFDSPSGTRPIVEKLPSFLREKWISEASRYQDMNNVVYPPLSLLADFLRKQARIRNDPGFCFQGSVDNRTNFPSKHTHSKQNVVVRKTELPSHETMSRTQDVAKLARQCPYHEKSKGHTLNYCRGFRKIPMTQTKEFLTKKGICYRCCESRDHHSANCKNPPECYFCKSPQHSSALHSFHPNTQRQELTSTSLHGGEENLPRLSAKCTQICNNENSPGKSCAKTILVRIFPQQHPEQCLMVYAMLDDQSNRTLAKSALFDHFNENADWTEYSLSSCSGTTVLTGRRATGYVVQSLDGTTSLNLPILIECNDIPDIREEIPTPDTVARHEHLTEISSLIPPLNHEAQILILIGRDLPAAHHVEEQRTGSSNAPYAQKLPLGWVVVGEMCLGKIHKTDHVVVNKTYMLNGGRPSSLKPCPNRFVLSEIGNDIFQHTKEDEHIAPSIEDHKFLELMERECFKDDNGNWTAPLPFRTNRPRLPCNRSQAIHRAKLLHYNLQKNSLKKEHMLIFMKGIIDKGHAEVAPYLPPGKECWYLPLFGVYNDKKPGQIRGVFDSSAKYENVSLNSVLMTGPDLTNDLVGILLRFRTGIVAVTSDIEQMFYCFKVCENHRDFLRFMWYKNNDTNDDLIEYRMTAHVFGNSPSPAIATYGLCRAVRNAANDVKNFVNENFYVDDALLSTEDPHSAIDLIKRTQQSMKEGGNIRLHKISSNNQEVLQAFHVDDLAKDVKDVSLSKDNPLLHKTLGMYWDLANDTFTFRVSTTTKPFTRRGVLSTISTLYDPLGMMGPVIIQGKLQLRKLMSTTSGWDEEISADYYNEWKNWCESLQNLQQVSIPRTYSHIPLSTSTRKEIHIFSDASKDAIAAVAYMKVYNAEGKTEVSFVFAKTKVAPRHGTTIPRLELCAALLSVEISQILEHQLKLHSNPITFYSDSRIVLGYIHNDQRRFRAYVANRVGQIRRISQPTQWQYVPSAENPADVATRSIHPSQISNSAWIKGPIQLRARDVSSDDTFPIVDPEHDCEVKSDVHTNKTSHSVCNKPSLGSQRFDRFSTWRSLVRAISLLRCLALSFAHNQNHAVPAHEMKSLTEAERIIIQTVQSEYFDEEIKSLKRGDRIARKSTILSLTPILDECNILRIGGRLKYSDISTAEKNPIIIPKGCHIATLLIRHFHEKIYHQGRHLTEAAIRTGGFWIIGGKRLISSILAKCVICRKLRGKTSFQIMAPLPADRVLPCPPFTYVGVDTFGPWKIQTRRTRGGAANSKRWAILFTCLVIRAVHIEVVEEISTSSFINCLRRFVSLRGEIRQLRSDRGTNFVGAADDLGYISVNVEDPAMTNFLRDHGASWLFNTPHSSHMGGAWERMIGIARRILDAMLLKNPKPLTHEVFTTFMCEVTAIMNARPLVNISTDPSVPQVLSPATLLMQKTNHIPTFAETMSVNLKDMYTSQWQHVQMLAEQFWKQWRRDYLQSLQVRNKWKQAEPNIKVGEVVLVRDKLSLRNEWPMGIVDQVFESKDGLVRKAAIRVCKDQKMCSIYPTNYRTSFVDVTTHEY